MSLIGSFRIRVIYAPFDLEGLETNPDQGNFSFAGGTMVELWRNHNYVLAMSTHEGKAELEGWQEVNAIVGQNVQASPPRLCPQ